MRSEEFRLKLLRAFHQSFLPVCRSVHKSFQSPVYQLLQPPAAYLLGLFDDRAVLLDNGNIHKASDCMPIKRPQTLTITCIKDGLV